MKSQPLAPNVHHYLDYSKEITLIGLPSLNNELQLIQKGGWVPPLPQFSTDRLRPENRQWASTLNALQTGQPVTTSSPRSTLLTPTLYSTQPLSTTKALLLSPSWLRVYTSLSLIIHQILPWCKPI
ncbi:hypothetical protein BGS_0013 [Beggiatoa sp. SS]|nr:hypothetical protein BGS_0013 [Beggiatoa sp. SS]